MSRRVLKPRLPRLRAGALGGNGSLVSASAEARGSRMIKPEDLEASDRHFVEQVMLSIRMLRGEIGPGDGGDARMQRAYALVLMSEALGVLDSIRVHNCNQPLTMAMKRLVCGPCNNPLRGITTKQS